MSTLEEVFFSNLEPTTQVHLEPLATPLHVCFNWQEVLDNINIIHSITPAAHPLLSDDNADREHGIDYELHEKELREQSPQGDGSITKIIKRSNDNRSYAAMPGTQSQNTIIVNDDDDAERLRKRKFYVVVFRSVRREGADTQALYSADSEAHREATSSGGLIRYWYGILNLRSECFATCIWNSREDAERASRLPKHRIAVSLAPKMYESYQLEKYWLTFDSTRGELSFEKIVG